MMHTKYVSIILKYCIGVLCWFVVFGILKLNCLYNMEFTVDNFWLSELHGGLVSNAMGSVALRSSHLSGERQCDDEILYLVKFHRNESETDGEFRSLSSIVDVLTWMKIDSDSITTTYVDSRHKYVLHRTSDGAYISAYSK